MTDITWNKNGDDYTAIVGEYVLSVYEEPYSAKIVTSLCYRDGNIIFRTAEKTTLESAKEAAVNAYKDHVNKSH